MSERIAEEERLVNLNRERAEELERTNEQINVQITNLKSLSFSHDKIISLQAQELRNIVEISNLMGTMNERTRAWADSQSKVAAIAENMLRKNENAFMRAAGFARDLAELQKNRNEVEKQVSKVLKEHEASWLAQGATQESIQEIKKNGLKTAQELQAEITKINEELTASQTGERKLSAEAEEQLRTKIEQLEVQRGISEEIMKADPESFGILNSYNKVAAASDKIKKNMVAAASQKLPEVFGQAVGKFADAYGKVQGIGAEMYKATGGMTSLMDNVRDTFMENGPLDLAQYGIGFENVSEAMVNLARRSGEFATANQETQAQIGLTAAKLERLGVTAETSAELFNILKLNFGSNAEQFAEMADTFVARSANIGMSVEQYTSDFQASYPVLSRYGADAANVFDKLARHARASGLSVQELVSNMDQFNTFQGAAENASKLNFLLGSQLDTTQLLMADEAERLDMIKGAFSPAQFENMDKFKKKAIAAAAGFTDISAFEKAMRGDADKLGDLAKTQQEKLDDATRKSTSEVEAFGKVATNVADQVALKLMPSLSESLGAGATGLYGMSKAASIGLTNVAGAAQLASTSLSMFASSRAGSFTGMSQYREVYGAQRAAGTGMASSVGHGMKAGWQGMAGLSKVMTGVGGIAALGAIAKDGYDMYESSSKGEEMKNEDIGGVVGGVLGSAVGILGGPAGVAIGATIGNTVGEQLGKFMDDSEEEMIDEIKKSRKSQDEYMKRIAENTGEAVAVGKGSLKELTEQTRRQKTEADRAKFSSSGDHNNTVRGYKEPK